MNEAETDYRTSSGPSDAELGQAVPPRALMSDARVGEQSGVTWKFE
ncbi:MAG: hypothetical protein OXI50_12700 [Gammaproteobacteria bacterium]|nr:hypothetical protein [Gammaproteobacteria bacterium]